MDDLKNMIDKLHLVCAGKNVTKLLYQTDLEPLYQAEKLYTASVAQFTNKLFIDVSITGYCSGLYLHPFCIVGY